MKGNYSKTVLKALDILEELSEVGESISNAEIAKRLDLNTSTTHRIMNTLVSKGYVSKEDGMYKMGHKVYNLKYLSHREDTLKKRAHPILAHLEESTGLTVTLGIREGLKAIPIDIITGYQNLVVNHNLGRPVPLHATSVGKCLVAFLPATERKEIAKRLKYKRYTPQTITGPTKLIQEMEMIAERGYASDEEEFVVGIKCVGAPIFGYQRELISAVSVAGLKGQFEEKSIDQVTGKVIKVGEEISSLYEV